MSADWHVMCPACTARELDKPISEITAKDLNYGEEGDLAERYVFYIDNGHVVIEYLADCDNCDYVIEFEYEHALPEVPDA